VANRGEIALRIIRACHELGCEAVAVYSDADADAPHVRAADLAVRLGPPPAADSYLAMEVIVAAALATGSQAVHPGYGFLSERAEFAEACERAGLTFVGPTASTLAGLGDKLSARRAAAAAGVPVVPGTLEAVTVDEDGGMGDVIAGAQAIGWPILVKAAAGGGGRGMRRVDRATDLRGAVVAASREAMSTFGDGSVYLERYVAGARHVEVQLLGDAQGEIVALGDRDCSVQRRHQKLLEEAPVPGLDVQQRRELHALAIAVARAFGLRNAATAEFLLEPAGRFWFLEVNTRLQVEHGVTELVTGLDLVQEQLWIAAGRPFGHRVLRAAEAAAVPTAHAIEARISAEDPARDFVPAPGTITRWRAPAGPGVRVDAGVEEGSVVWTDYDPLLAKVMVVAEDRPLALRRLRRALGEFEVGGVQTTLPFHRWIVGHPAFIAGRLSTAFVPDHWNSADVREPALLRAAELAAAAWATTAPSAPGADGPRAVGSGAVAEAASPPRRAAQGVPSEAHLGRSSWARTARREAIERWPR